MRVDLRLQGAQLRPGRELLLALKLVDGELRGNEVGVPRHQRVLGAVHVARAPDVELEGTDGTVAHAQGRHDARRDLAHLAGLAPHGRGASEGLVDAMLDGVERGRGMDGRAGWKFLGKRA